MPVSRRKALWLLGIIAAGALAGVAARAVDRQGAAADVLTIDSIVIPAGSDPEAAAREMSAIVDFEIRLPSYLPEGEAVTAVWAPSEPKARQFQYVQIGIRGATGGMLITEHNAALAVPQSGEELQLPAGGPRVWRSSGEWGRTYRAVSSDGRWYHLQLRATSSLSEDEVLKVIDGLLEQ